MLDTPMGGNRVMDVERWTGKRKAEAVVDILKRRVTLVDFCQAHDLKQSEVEKWTAEFLKAGVLVVPQVCSSQCILEELELSRHEHQG